MQLFILTLIGLVISLNIISFSFIWYKNRKVNIINKDNNKNDNILTIIKHIYIILFIISWIIYLIMLLDINSFHKMTRGYNTFFLIFAGTISLFMVIYLSFIKKFKNIIYKISNNSLSLSENIYLHLINFFIVLLFSFAVNIVIFLLFIN